MRIRLVSVVSYDDYITITMTSMLLIAFSFSPRFAPARRSAQTIPQFVRQAGSMMYLID